MQLIRTGNVKRRGHGAGEARPNKVNSLYLSCRKIFILVLDAFTGQ